MCIDNLTLYFTLNMIKCKTEPENKNSNGDIKVCNCKTKHANKNSNGDIKLCNQIFTYDLSA